MKTTYFLPFCMVLLVAICGATNAAAQMLALSDTPTNTLKPVTVNRSLVLQLVNDARRKGCQCGDTYYYPALPLAWNTQLETAAIRHSADMERNNYFNHKAPDGSRGGDRIARAGYHWKAYGENIGEGYRTEREMVKGWLASPGHCKNIMNKAYKEMGVARAGNLWTQTFGSR